MSWVLLPYEFLLEQNFKKAWLQHYYVLLPYEFLLEQNLSLSEAQISSILLPYEFLLEQNRYILQYTVVNSFVTIRIFARTEQEC